MEFRVLGNLRGLQYKPAKGGPVVVIGQEVEASGSLGQLGMFCGQEVAALYETSRGERSVTGTLLKFDYRPAEDGPVTQIQLEVPGDALLGELGMSVGKDVRATYTPWQLSLDDAAKDARRGAGGQMPLSQPGSDSGASGEEAKDEPQLGTLTLSAGGESVTVTGEQLARAAANPEPFLKPAKEEIKRAGCGG